ncbi:hypothetical protein AWB64_06198 [Caballeronia sordidicola]|uniref:Uncharacterized protein n=1 Tax=Caballeronia sordidicola TaxID=196367 RepID=A0A158IH36_CABSO|nr:hypothetical protein [Caballeronia sordidicola]SAL55942.1 hypothetical protein AWB64_06198 [Caballeronia sordidicola]
MLNEPMLTIERTAARQYLARTRGKMRRLSPRHSLDFARLHLDHAYESSLPDIFSHHTSSQVVRAADSMAIEIDYVYVILPAHATAMPPTDITMYLRHDFR